MKGKSARENERFVTKKRRFPYRAAKIPPLFRRGGGERKRPRSQNCGGEADGVSSRLVRVGRLELPASCSQSKRAANCATPGWNSRNRTWRRNRRAARRTAPRTVAPHDAPHLRTAPRLPRQGRRADGVFFIVPNFSAKSRGNWRNRMPVLRLLSQFLLFFVCLEAFSLFLPEI